MNFNLEGVMDAMRKELKELIVAALQKAKEKGNLILTVFPEIGIEWTKEEKFGDFSSNIALALTTSEKKPPREIAQIILEELVLPPGLLEKIEIAGPGFINFFAKKEFWLKVLPQAVYEGKEFGSLNLGQGKKVQIEFVSANPTGPLHIGHGRGAALGDALSNILKKAGWEVTKEYYINDVGIQMELLGRSTYIRYQQLLGKEVPFIENGYQGDYIKDIARNIIAEQGDRFLYLTEEEALPFFTRFAAQQILDGIKKDLCNFGVEFDNWFSENTLYQNQEVEAAISLLKEKDLVYEKEGALWQKATEFDDEKDRVILRSTGQPTYFASDIAYHINKFRRGFDLIIDIWGADHHGYVPRIKGVVKALGYPESALQILLYQLVSLIKDGQPVFMSTRSGQFASLAELIEEVGKDASRFFFLMRRADSHLEFDLDLAKKHSSDNPVYYVQYAHARICSIFRQAERKGVRLPKIEEIDLGLLNLPEEFLLAKKIAYLPDLIEECVLSLEPHRITYYLQDLVSIFHSYYNKHRIISSDLALTYARLLLLQAIQVVLVNALALIGVSAPEKM
jgi:arginyl-tRNA synthetase